MTEQAFFDGVLWVFAVGGGLIFIFFVVLGLAALGEQVYRCIKKTFRRRQIRRGINLRLTR